MKFISFLTILFMTGFSSNGQNLVGYSAKDIRKYMSKNRSEMNIENVTNKTFSYLRYSDRYDTETILFFLRDDSVCYNMRIVCSKNIRSSKIKELDSVYSRTGENIWADRRSGKNYNISLVDDDWSFSISIESEQ